MKIGDMVKVGRIKKNGRRASEVVWRIGIIEHMDINGRWVTIQYKNYRECVWIENMRLIKIMKTEGEVV